MEKEDKKIPYYKEYCDLAARHTSFIDYINRYDDRILDLIAEDKLDSERMLLLLIEAPGIMRDPVKHATIYIVSFLNKVSDKKWLNNIYSVCTHKIDELRYSYKIEDKDTSNYLNYLIRLKGDLRNRKEYLDNNNSIHFILEN